MAIPILAIVTAAQGLLELAQKAQKFMEVAPQLVKAGKLLLSADKPEAEVSALLKDVQEASDDLGARIAAYQIPPEQD